MCHPCTEDCFLNWDIIITREADKVNQLNGNVTELLESFGSMSVDSINSTLQMLKKNVSYAEEIFSSGGRENLQKKQQQINRVNDITDLFLSFLPVHFECSSIRCFPLRLVFLTYYTSKTSKDWVPV